MSLELGRRRAAQRHGPPFLGGLISAALLYLVWADDSLQALAWLSLTPFFYGLSRNGGAALLRFAQGVSLLAPLGLIHYRDGAHVVVPALGAGLMAIAAGPLLRGRRPLVYVFGLPVLWVGLEVGRGLLAPIGPHPAAGWLTLGSVLRPGEGPSQLAAFIGLYGVSFAVALASACFATVLIAGRWWQQAIWAAFGLSIALGCQWVGNTSLPPMPAATEQTSIVRVAAEPAGDFDKLEKLTRLSTASRHDLVVWPRLAQRAHSGPDGSAAAEQPNFDSLRQQTATVVTASEAPDAQLQAILVDPSGRPRGQAMDRREPTLFKLPRGTLAVISGEDLVSPMQAREAAASGAHLFAGVAREPATWTELAVRHQAALSRYRAIENHRWLLYAGWRTAFVADPAGREAFAIHGFEGAGDGRAEWRFDASFYCRLGWWIEPVLLVAAAWFVIRALIGAVVRRKERGEDA